MRRRRGRGVRRLGGGEDERGEKDGRGCNSDDRVLPHHETNNLSARCFAPRTSHTHRRLCRPIVNIFNGEMGGKKWRNAVDEIMKTAGSKRRGYKDESGDERKLSELMIEALGVMDEGIVEQSRETTMEIMLLKEEIVRGGKDCGGGVDGVAREAIKIWNEERRERERIIKEEEGDVEEEALKA